MMMFIAVMVYLKMFPLIFHSKQAESFGKLPFRANNEQNIWRVKFLSLHAVIFFVQCECLRITWKVFIALPVEVAKSFRDDSSIKEQWR